MNERVDAGARVWRAGSGPPMVLLHGEFGDAATYWGPIVDSLAAHVTLILPDLPGFGASPPLVDFHPRSYLFWLKQFVDATCPETPRQPPGPAVRSDILLGGAGFGATLARLFAARHRTRVRRLILSGGGSLERPSRLRGLLSQIAPGTLGGHRGGEPRSASDLFYDPLRYAGTEFRQALDRTRPVRGRVLQAFREAPLPPQLTPDCTTLLLWGNEDRYCPLATQQVIVGEIGDTRQVDIFEAGHMVTIEQPHRFSAHLIDFAASRG